MTRRKRHLIRLSRVVRDDEISSAIWVILARIDDFLYLVDTLAIKISPLITIDWSELTPLFRKIGIGFYFFNKDFHFLLPFWGIFWILFFESIFFEIGLKWPFIPNSDIIIDEVFDIGIS